jgi:polyhydroxyalkanoate synthesis repressor PhaR
MKASEAKKDAAKDTEKNTEKNPDKNMKAETKKPPVIIKKYANRRLYNTATSIYVTLEDLCLMVQDEEEFLVKDAKTGEDITRQILTQIIFEQELRGSQMLPLNFLRSVIRFYGDEVQKALPSYLDAMMENFIQNQEKLNDAVRQSVGKFSPFSQFEELGKQNMALFQQAFSAFNVFDPHKNEKK